MRRPVKDFMTTEVVTVRRDADVHELEKLFIEHRVHGLPVVDENDRLVGVVSQTDLVSWHYQLGIDGAGFYDLPQLQPPREVEDEENPTLEQEEREERERETLPLSDIRTARVEEVMTPLVHAIREENSAIEAAARMLRHGIHRLVVVNGELRVLGIVSAMDLLRLIPGVESTARTVVS
ncbi:MAG: CBS domain-containing protein [Acidobacteriota bacterium]|nr:CBS domain-containing protein [Acidobacteriota bacterium]MDQ7088276.1 CBS domain-containing protein [Acidobacteriota bacterium]